MASNYEEVISQLGQVLSFPLAPDSSGACAILIENELRIQIEQTPEEDRIVAACTVADLNPGPMRREIAERALQENAGGWHHPGFFAYSRQAHSLVLMQYFPLEGLTGKELFSQLEPFAELAWSWYKELQAGSLPPLRKQLRSEKPRFGRGDE